MAVDAGCCWFLVRVILPIVMIVIGSQNLEPRDLGAQDIDQQNFTSQDLGHLNKSVSEPRLVNSHVLSYGIIYLLFPAMS